MIPAWVEKYVGIPFKDHGRDEHGADCYGLYRLALMREFGKLLPSYDDTYADANNSSAAAAIDTLRSLDFISLPYPEVGAAVVLRVKGLPWHIGMMVSDHFFLHVMRGINSVVERIDSMAWANRVVGFYRYA